MNVEVLRLKGPREVVFVDTGLDAVALVQEVVPVRLAPAVVKELALAGVRVVEETPHSVKILDENYT